MRLVRIVLHNPVQVKPNMPQPPDKNFFFLTDLNEEELKKFERELKKFLFDKRLEKEGQERITFGKFAEYVSDFIKEQYPEQLKHIDPHTVTLVPVL